MTIDEIVKRIRPTHVAVVNPKIKGVPTPGNTKVESFHLDFEDTDILMWVTIA